MSTFAEEVAFCTGRIARSTALTESSTDSCARVSHVGIARAYGQRLAALDGTSHLSTQVETSMVHVQSFGRREMTTLSGSTPSGLDDRSSEPSHDQPSIEPDRDLPHLRASVLALENVVVAMLAGGSSDQHAAVHNMALFVQPLLGVAPDHAAGAAEMCNERPE
jgi:hypothetical protein